LTVLGLPIPPHKRGGRITTGKPRSTRMARVWAPHVSIALSDRGVKCAVSAFWIPRAYAARASTPELSSGNQFLPQRFGDGLGSVASAELGLRLFQVASNGLRADIERLGNLRRLRAGGRQSQDGKFPGR
jgi:hypothetical protein